MYYELAMTIAAALGFVYGAFRYLQPHKPLYASMIVLGTGCIALGHLYSFLRLMTGFSSSGVFHVGILGTIGAFSFFFSANYGQIDSLVDDGREDYNKYRLIPFIPVAVIILMYIWIMMSPATAAERTTDGIAAIFIGAAAYFHMKHLVIPDVDYGVVRCQRGYNALALAYGLLCMTEKGLIAYGINDMLLFVCISQCIITLFMIPVMDKGVRAWSR
ncbi:MAG: hypothetical protein II936_09565 [Oscillospiraceae bacterium]|nr:hypothetical protein [Oscillospiraceae bacterium]